MIALTNGIEIPDNAIQLCTITAIDDCYVSPRLQLVQYDKTIPVAAVQLTYKNQPYIPPTGAEINVRMKKPDGKGVYNPCLGMDSSGIVYFAFTQQMTAVSGDGTLTVEVTDSGVKNSAPITVNVAENPVQEGSIESADEFLTLQEILQQAEKWGQIVQTNASNIQQVVNNLEDIQNAAENAQAAAASAAAAQQAAQEALGFRTFFSAVRPDANGNLDPSRPMTVGPAASLTIESEGDRIQSVTALGFTQQAGTGDPSPTNVRQLTNGGLKLVKLVLTGTSSDGSWSLNGTLGNGYLRVMLTKSGVASRDVGLAYCDSIPFLADFSQESLHFFNTENALYFFVQAASLDAAQKYLAGKTVWYTSADESQATGLYAPIILTSGEYRATCLPLTAPLCEGDSVVSWVKSGCDMQVTLDGGTSDGFVYADEGASGNMRRMRVTIPGVLDYNSGGFGFSDWVKYKTDYGSTEESFYCGGNSVFLFLAAESLAAAKQILSQKPLTMWLRSVNYTAAADIPVSLETHVQAVLVLDGDTGWVWNVNPSGSVYRGYIKAQNLKNAGEILCSVAKKGDTRVSVNAIQVDGGNLLLSLEGYSEQSDFEAFKAYLSSNPATVVAQLATPITYAHPAVMLEATTGDQLTYTVTGQSGGQVSVSIMAMQNGGHAKTADNATTAQNAANAANATEFDGHTWSEIPGQAPVQSVNGATGMVMLTAASVGALSTAQIELGTLTSPSQLPAQNIAAVHFDSAEGINANASSAPFTDYAVGDFYGLWLGQSSKVFGTLLITSPRFGAYFWVAQVWDGNFAMFKKFSGV